MLNARQWIREKSTSGSAFISLSDMEEYAAFVVSETMKDRDRALHIAG